MSHEVRTPLNAISGLIHLALGRELSPTVRGYLSMARTAESSLLNVVNDILDFSRIESRKLDLESVYFDLHEILEEVSGVSEVRAGQKGLRLSFAVDGQVPRTLKGDPMRLKQVLLNLVGNAIKFTEAGSIDVSVSAREAAVPEEERICLCFSIKDTGIGIGQEQIELLFEPFTQADASTTRKYGGSGLGLTISKQLVELMGGKIEVESRPGEGSLFSFTAVFEAGGEKGAIPTTLLKESSFASSRAGKDRPPVFGARVLLVDDNEVNRIVAAELLQDAGIAVKMAISGKEAVEAIGRESYDLVFMDIQMSEMDGYEATRQIRLSGSTVPIVAMTAKAMAGERERCLSAGMSDFLSKPFEPEDLYRAVARWLPFRGEDGVPPASTVAPEPCDGLPPIASIDTRLGLQRANGNPALYRRLLRTVAANHAQSCFKAQEQMDRGAMEEAARTVHSLKGAAGSIGATPLFEIARELETALDGRNLGRAHSLSAELLEEHERVLAAIDALGGPGEVSETAIPAGASAVCPAEAKGLIDQLSFALRTRNTISQSLLHTLKETLGTGPRATYLSQLERHVADFDFDDALKVLQEMMNDEN